MRNIVFTLLLLTFVLSNAQSKEQVFKKGEWLKYRMHYGLVNAGFATVDLQSTTYNDKEVYHVIGKGWTTGVTKLFFKVKDKYQTWFYKDNMMPYHFKRRVDEGGHIISRDIYFNQKEKIAHIKDHKRNTEKTASIDNVQDILSSFYHLRNQDVSKLKVSGELKLNMFLDYETFGFKMRYLGEEVIKTKYGKIRCMKFRPSVQSGRIFKAKESLTIWITADKNKIPIRIKADLAVGSLKADLDQFKGLSHPFNIIF